MKYSIIIITPPDTGQTDGVATFCSCLSVDLTKTGLFNIHVVTPTPEITALTPVDDTLSDNLHYYRCPLPSGREGVGRYVKDLSAGNPCIVMLNYWPSIFNIRSIRKYMPEASIVQVVHDLPWLSVFEGNTDRFFESYGSGFSEYPQPGQKFLKYSTYDTLVSFKETDHIVCLCSDTLKIINRNYQIPLNKIHLIPNGSQDHNCFVQEGEELMSDPDPGTLNVLFVGRPTVSKGWDRVIELAARFQSKGINGTIICAGFEVRPDDVPDSLASYFIGLGTIPHHELDKLYRQADFVFIPTRHEQCSYVAVEAMMHGAEIVAYDSFGLRDMLDNDCAYIIESTDRFPELPSGKGPLARKRYLDRFTLDSMINNYSELLCRIRFS